MAPLFTFLSLLILSSILLTSAATFEQQLDTTEAALRSTGYNLFGNAIATSDLRYRLLSSGGNSSFTLFAPLDSTLYSLDMASPATAYTQTLYYHVATGRHTISDLQDLCYLETLLPHYSILVNQNAQNDTIADGVPIVLPDLFVGSEFAVHGLDGILIPGELGFDNPVHDSDVHSPSPQASAESDLHLVSPVISPSPEVSPRSQPKMVSPTISPSPELLPPPVKPKSIASPRSSRSETKNKSLKRKNRAKVGRSKITHRHGHGHGEDEHNNHHGRFSKFNGQGSDF